MNNHRGEPEPSRQIVFTPEIAKEFKVVYNLALSDGKDSFVFKDCVILVSYAKYLIEYLKTRGLLT